MAIEALSFQDRLVHDGLALLQTLIELGMATQAKQPDVVRQEGGVSRAVRLDACGSWHVSQAPSANGLCALPEAPTRLAFMSAWQVKQRSPAGFAKSFVSVDACGSWHVAQVASRTGPCTKAFAN